MPVTEKQYGEIMKISEFNSWKLALQIFWLMNCCCKEDKWFPAAFQWPLIVNSMYCRPWNFCEPCYFGVFHESDVKCEL
jgi:hypothetical protein